jgi:hypothetical protein
MVARLGRDHLRITTATLAEADAASVAEALAEAAHPRRGPLRR